MFDLRTTLRATFIVCGVLVALSVGVSMSSNKHRFLSSKDMVSMDLPEIQLAVSNRDTSLVMRKDEVGTIADEAAAKDATSTWKVEYATNTTRFISLQELQKYVQQHSEEQLEIELKACLKNRKPGDSSSSCLSHRRFLLADYSCPLQAGNRMHWFLNNMLWAILTNRTVLWRYLDKDTCTRIMENGAGPNFVQQAQEACQTANEKSACDAVLSMAPWIPSFERWNATLQFGAGMPPIQNYTSMDDSPRLIQAGSFDNQKDAKFFANSLKTDHQKQLWQSLFEFRYDFLYGMLFENSFKFTDRIQPKRSTVADPQFTRTVAVHARHPYQSDVGGNIDGERQCLELYLRKYDGPCAVYILSDRPLTIQLLRNVTESLNCTPISVTHEKESYGYIQEHGPYAGEEFFRDLALASNARYGFVVSLHNQGRRRIGLRSSSALLLEIMEYRSRLEGAERRIPRCHK